MFVADSWSEEQLSFSVHNVPCREDDDDNKFVDCAFVCQADFIVTDDGHFDDAANSQFPLFRVMGLDEFAKRMKE